MTSELMTQGNKVLTTFKVKESDEFKLEIAKFLLSFTRKPISIKKYFEEWITEYPSFHIHHNTPYSPDFWRPYMNNENARKYWEDVLHTYRNRPLTSRYFNELLQIFRETVTIKISAKELAVLMAIVKKQTEEYEQVTQNVPFKLSKKKYIEVKNKILDYMYVKKSVYLYPYSMGLDLFYGYIELWQGNPRVLEFIKSSPWIFLFYPLNVESTSYFIAFLVPFIHKKEAVQEFLNLMQVQGVKQVIPFTYDTTRLDHFFEIMGFEAYDCNQHQWDIQKLTQAFMQPANKFKTNEELQHPRMDHPKVDENKISQDFLRFIEQKIKNPRLNLKQISQITEITYSRLRKMNKFARTMNIIYDVYFPNYYAFNLDLFLIYVDYLFNVLPKENPFLTQPALRSTPVINGQYKVPGDLLLLYTHPSVYPLIKNYLHHIKVNGKDKIHTMLNFRIITQNTSYTLPINGFDDSQQKWVWNGLFQ